MQLKNGRTIPLEFILAVAMFRAVHGKKWRSILWEKWLNGQDYYEKNGSVLRQIRNDGCRDEILDALSGSRIAVPVWDLLAQQHTHTLSTENNA